jgi:hypothetical protein
MTDYFIGFSQQPIRYPHFLKQHRFIFFKYLNLLENYLFSKTQLWTLRNLWCSLCPFLLQLPNMGTTCICTCIFGWEKQYAQSDEQKCQMRSTYVTVHFAKRLHELNVSNHFPIFSTTRSIRCCESLH